MSLTGKGWFIWQVSRCERGDPAAIAAKAASTGTTHVLIKIAERSHAYGLDRFGRDLVAPVAATLRARGLQVWGWHYVYGDQPVDEAEVAARRFRQLQLDGYVVNAEAQYKRPGKSVAAQRFMATLRAGLPVDALVALSSYRYPALHRQFPWRVFLESCDLVMPQVYWEQAHNPAPQLARSIREFSDARLVGHVRPIVPTGAAYGAGNWRATPEDLVQFLNEARRQRLPAANFYSWDYATSPGHTELWDAVASYSWLQAASNLDADAAVLRYFKSLNGGSLERLLNCYHLNAALVTPERTRYGRSPLAEWLQALLADLPGAVFTLQTMVGTGNSRHVTWTARSSRAHVLDGADTFGVLGGLIQYHFTTFTLTPTPAATLTSAPPDKRLHLTALQYL
jgi:hypothetical protein